MTLLNKLSKLRWQLMISYLPLIITPVLLVGLVTRSVAEQGVTVWVTEGAKQQARLLSPCVAKYYEARGSWHGLSKILKWSAADQVYLAGSASASSSPERNITVMRGPFFDFNVQCYPLPGQQSADVFSFLRVKVPVEPDKPGALEAAQESKGNTWDMEPKRPDRPVSSEAAQESAAALPGDPIIAQEGEVVPLAFGIRDFFKGGETLITDPNGVVVASSNEANIGQDLGASALSAGAPIIVNGKMVGALVIGRALGVVDPQQRQLLDTVNGALVLSGVLSVVLAAGLGFGLSWRISVPVQQLMAGVKRLSAGEWTAPLEVKSRNEFGELTTAFNTMASEVTRQQQLSRQMIADIAHDLRTPLSVMALEVEAIEAGFQTPTEAATSLRQEITWLQRLVDDLRLLSLMDADQIHMQLESTPLNAFLCGVHDFWQILASEGDCQLSLDAPANLPDVSFDASRIRQVLGNLIDNAIRHTKPGGRITLGARAESGAIKIWVTDDGEGIAPADLPHVFDRFYRVDPSRSRSSSGSGLGLSISRRLVEMHGGAIQVSSMPGHGATFAIRLPQKAAEPKDPKKWVRHLDTLYPSPGVGA